MKQEKECLICGKKFLAQRITGNYCSHACRQRAYIRNLNITNTSIHEKSTSLQDVSVTKNSATVTYNELASHKQVLGSSLEIYTDPYRHCNSVATPNRSLKYYIKQLLSYQDNQVSGMELLTAGYGVESAWKNKRYKVSLDIIDRDFIENELLPIIQGIKAELNEEDVVYLDLPRDAVEKLKSLLAML